MSRKRKKKNLLKKLLGQDGLNLELDIEEGLGREIIAVGWIILGLIIFLAEFNAAGVLGRQLFNGLRFLFGLTAYLLPFLFLWIGFAIGKFFSIRFSLRVLIGVILILIALPSLVHLMTNGDPLEVAKAGGGGGVYGFYLSYKLAQTIGGIASFIISLALTLIGILTVINKSLTILINQLFHPSETNEVAVNGAPNEQISLFSSVKRTIGSWRGNIAPAKARVLDMPVPKTAVLAHTSGLSSSNYTLPPVTILETSDQVASSGNIQKNIEIIQKTLKDFGIDVQMSDVNVGPTVTQYTMKPAEGVKLNQITARSNDLALALAAKSLRMEAPIPGKSAVGIEIPNKIIARVTLREILESKEYQEIKSPLSLALGRDVAGAPMGMDLEKMPHLLIAGATGSGKSVCINALILSLLFSNTPKDLRFIMVDPKRVELTNFNAIPHLLAPVITEAAKTVAALKWAVAEMDRRYRILAETGKKNITAYNQVNQDRMPYIVFIVDELADLMAVSAREVEGSIVRLSQMARATGIHLILATQRPSVDVITGLIKANITSRIAFAVASNADSRTILDQSGAEKLLGNGDMLYLGNDLGKPKRIQGALATEKDISEVIKYVKSQDMVQYNEEVTTVRSSILSSENSISAGNEDDLYNEAMGTVRAAGKASASLLQRRLRIGYARAARLLDLLEENGAIGPADGAKPREVFGSQAPAGNRYSDEDIGNFN